MIRPSRPPRKRTLFRPGEKCTPQHPKKGFASAGMCLHQKYFLRLGCSARFLCGVESFGRKFLSVDDPALSWGEDFPYPQKTRRNDLVSYVSHCQRQCVRGKRYRGSHNVASVDMSLWQNAHVGGKALHINFPFPFPPYIKGGGQWTENYSAIATFNYCFYLQVQHLHYK